jgi:lipoprotein-anchoring transpeptidase ErfK/SrfK
MACSAVVAASADAAAAGLGGGLIEFLFSGGTQSAAPQRQAYAPDADAVRYAADPRYVRQMVDYHGEEKPGTVIINTPERMLYLVEPGGRALRYGIGVETYPVGSGPPICSRRGARDRPARLRGLSRLMMSQYPVGSWWVASPSSASKETWR